MFEARRIPPKGSAARPIGDADAAPSRAPLPVTEPERWRRARIVGAITPGTATARVITAPQARAAAAWRAWVHTEPPRATAHDGRGREHAANAEMLVWQNRLRLAFVGTASGAALLLRLGGVLHASPVSAQAVGQVAAFVLHVAVVVVYGLIVLVVDRHIARRRAAGRVAVLGLVLADQSLIFATTFLLSPPQYFARALLLAFFSLQLTQTFFGRRTATLALASTVLGYALLCAIALRLGGRVDVAEESWTVALFLGGAGAAMAVQGALASRLNRLVGLFERTEEGDFTQAYDEAADVRPDAITRVGRAYNRMRVQLAAIVLSDPLSGCLNRRGFDDHLAREIARAARAGGELAIIGLDIDYFKRINDTFGHLAGDAVIREAGALLRDTLRSGDVVARVGGEEFMVVAPETGAAGAFHLASRIVDAFRKRAFTGVSGRIPVTVSAGVVADRVTTPHVTEDLKARADEALYAAKRAGRNRVAMWSGVKEGAGR